MQHLNLDLVGLPLQDRLADGARSVARRGGLILADRALRPDVPA